VTKTTACVSILAAGATLGLLSYAFTRRSKLASGRPNLARSDALSSRAPSNVASSSPVSLASVPAVQVFALLDDTSLRVAPTVRCVTPIPRQVGADDAEALEPDDMGEDWLSRATQSERSLGEADLEIDIENVAFSLDESEPEETDSVDS
jgi:hypothetical protein